MIIKILTKAVIVAVIIDFCSAIRCPTKEEIVPVDIKKLEGTWYIVGATPPNRGTVNKCGRFKITMRKPEELSLVYDSVTPVGEPMNYTAAIRQVNGEVLGIWKRSTHSVGVFKHQFITFVEGSHFAMIACNDNLVNCPFAHATRNPPRAFLVIGSKTQAYPDPATEEAMKNQAATFVNQTDIVNVDQTDCAL